MNDRRSSENITVPAALLDTDPVAMWVFAQLASAADSNGTVTVRVNSWCHAIGLSRQQLRTALSKLASTKLITNSPTNSPTNKSTNITIISTDNYNTPRPTRQPTIQPTLQPINQPPKQARQRQSFTPPTVEEVREHIIAKGYSVDAEKFVAHYESNGWMVGRNKMKNWRMALVTWEKNQYGTRREAPATDNAATRAESRDRLRSLASGVLSQSADRLLDLYNGCGTDPDNR